MGNPGPDDRHPVHGELPNLPYSEAWLVFGEDSGGAYVDLCGAARDTLAFDHDFVFRPRLRIRAGATVLEAAFTVENKARAPLPFLYMGHINFRPADGGVLIDTVRDDARDIAIGPTDLGPNPRDEVRRYREAVFADVSSHRTIRAGVPVEPELVLTMRAAEGDDGWSHGLQRRPDGTGDFVSHRPRELPYAVRWLTRTPDQDALGLVLPATGSPDGRAAARRNGQFVRIEPGGSFQAEMRFGALDAAGSADLERAIAAIRNR